MLLFDHTLLPSAKKITKIIQLTSSPSAGSSQTVKCTSLLSPALQRAERCPNPFGQRSARKASRSARQLLKGVKNPRGLRPGLCGQDCDCPPASAATFPRKEKSRVPVQPPCSTRPPHGRAPRRSRSAAHNGKLRASRSQGNRQGNRRRSQPFTRGSRGQNPTFSKGEACLCFGPRLLPSRSTKHRSILPAISGSEHRFQTCKSRQLSYDPSDKALPRFSLNVFPGPFPGEFGGNMKSVTVYLA